MIKRTWPYGMQKKVKVVSDDGSGAILILIAVDENNEAYVCMFGSADAIRLKPTKVGDKGVITFKQGGPTGGYWDYEKEDDKVHTDALME